MASQLTRNLAHLLVDGVGLKRSVLAEAGIVDQNIDGEAGALGGIVKLLRRGRIVEVGDNRADFGSPGFQFPGEDIEPVFAACGENRALPHGMRALALRQHRCPHWPR